MYNGTSADSRDKVFFCSRHGAASPVVAQSSWKVGVYSLVIYISFLRTSIHCVEQIVWKPGTGEKLLCAVGVYPFLFPPQSA